MNSNINIEKIRTAKKMNEAEIAYELDMSFDTYETKQDLKNLKGQRLIDISKKFNVSVDYLLDQTDFDGKIDQIYNSIKSILGNAASNTTQNYIENDIWKLYVKIDEVFKNKNFISSPTKVYKPDEKEIQDFNEYFNVCQKKISSKMYDNKLSSQELGHKISVKKRVINRYLNPHNTPNKIKMDIFIKIITELGLTFRTLDKDSLLTGEFHIMMLTKRYENLTPDGQDMFIKFAEYLSRNKIKLLKTPCNINADKKTFPERLKYLRKTNESKTQRSMARRISESNKFNGYVKCSDRTIRNIEAKNNIDSNGNDKTKMKYVVAIADIFDCSIDYLIGRSKYNISISDFNAFCHRYNTLSEDNQKIIQLFLET